MKLNHGFIMSAALTGLVLTGCQSYSPTATKWEVLFDGRSIEQAQQNFRGFKPRRRRRGHHDPADVLELRARV
jgi:hypothetical protein